MSETRELLARRHKAMGASPLFYDEPLHFVRGEGVHLYAADGRRYLDCYNNIPVVGHCHPHVAEAITRQNRTLNVHSRYLSQNIVDYSERLLGTFSCGLDQVLYTCSGSEANEQALRIARMLGRGRGIICSNYAYHGNTAAVDQVSPLMHRNRQYFTEVRSVPFPETYRPLDGLAGEALIEAYLAEIQGAIDSFEAAGIGFAGMIFCPIFANEGLPNIPSGLLQRAVALVRKAGGLIIIDEVQSGFGRTGTLWGHDLMGITPDIVTLGKPMGNGYPVAALVSRGEILDAFRATAFYFNTFAASQTAAAAASAVLDVIEGERLPDNARTVGNFIRHGFTDLARRHTLIGDIRGEGLWVGVELVRDRLTREPAAWETWQLVNALRQHGILVSRTGPFGNVLKMRPPLVFSQENAEELLCAVDFAFGSLGSAEGRRDALVSDMSGVSVRSSDR
ncbi:4-aminobutyrate aminotransferase [Pseudomonas delhiensis]|uniref:4-aminobutyrate aminotransferase n=1 Tax=Pseudomonas delhiensis TaxID=366289 RepID=A0A239IW63_9PSED|nr:aspartate aminotransferase family protein [Pseudomonas delhiensis]SDK11875.1 4-aminobutyrate aminotransferase [Pseudomonas delhiensis]SNS97870.1 4-aminobutyrate aminotransferase [Pseudomonas delhiensis]